MRKPLLVLAALAAVVPTTPAQAAAPNAVTAVNSMFVLGDVTVVTGGSLTFVNLDPIPHDITAVDDDDNDGIPNFQAKASERGTAGSVVEVPGVASLAPGWHQFYCVAHETMRGTIHVVPPL